MRTYHLFIEHIPPKDNEHVGTIYEAVIELDDDPEVIKSFGGLKPYLDHHWNKIPSMQKWEIIEHFPLSGELHILAVKGNKKNVHASNR